ncbi:glycosyltransferase family 2 protein [Candidatus Clostridium helianthi]|uniref:Glycosyltransferase family 2 protein n=1 Tax=Candidatus Clostridium helianthi TaxID=3381660 RepID=A0ABW8S3M6_9CLOT
MVSIIIPVYNVSSYLERCIHSVINQTYKDIEIIIINDGSTDKSEDICLKWAKKDGRIIYISKKNEGLGSARNVGIKAAHYDYITFLDSDDWLEDTYIEKIINAMKSTNADIGLCDIYYVDSLTMKKNVSKIRLDANCVSVLSETSIINKIRTFAWGKIYKKKLFIENKIEYPDFTFEDIACTPILAALSERVVYVPDALCNYYRNRKGSLSNNAKNIKDIISSLKLMNERFLRFNIQDKYKLEIKKLLLGQARFAYQKWKDENSKEIEDLLIEFIEMIGKLDRDLKKFNEKKVYVINDALLQNSVKKVIFDENQLTTDINTADYFITYINHNTEGGYKRIIEVPQVSDIFDDKDIISWNIAEFIMEEL